MEQNAANAVNDEGQKAEAEQTDPQFEEAFEKAKPCADAEIPKTCEQAGREEDRSPDGAQRRSSPARCSPKMVVAVKPTCCVSSP